MQTVSQSISEGLIDGRLWLYVTYRCNQRCAYCLTGSTPETTSRDLDRATVLRLGHEACDLGFTSLGLTGGEPMMLDWLPEVAAELSDCLPVVVLTNGTLARGARLQALRPLVGRDVTFQVSLDHATPSEHDALRGEGTHARALAGIRALLDLGIPVRVGTTIDSEDPVPPPGMEALLAELGIPPEDHVVRRMVSRGRAATEQLGHAVGTGELAPELTITADGAFWSSFAPTVTGGRLDTDLIVTETAEPLAVAAHALLDLVRPMRRVDVETLGFR